jgi:hypothetical protein
MVAVAGHIDRFDDGDVLYVGDVGGVHYAQDLSQAWIHPGSIERGAATLAGLFDDDDDDDDDDDGRWVVAVAVMPGDPVGGGDEVKSVVLA